jgi:hypothetical protein
MSYEGEGLYQHGKPADDMCCLVTYEDITDEDKNYGTSNVHEKHITIVAYTVTHFISPLVPFYTQLNTNVIRR